MHILYRARSEWNIRTNFNHLVVAALETSLGKGVIPNQDDYITRYPQPENVVALSGHLNFYISFPAKHVPVCQKGGDGPLITCAEGRRGSSVRLR